MITVHVVRFMAVVMATIVLVAETLSAAETNSTQTLVAGETAFARDLYAQLKARDGNLFFSPYSISTCLGMTYVGARGDTGDEMARAMHWEFSPTELAAPMGALEKELNSVRQAKGMELNTANGLWAQAGLPFLPAFLQVAQQQFSASVKRVDFHTQAEPTRQRINDWVSAQTKGKITDLLPPGVVNSSTRLVLVNAIYFKGRWMHPFNPTHTADAAFTVAPGQQVQARLMTLEKNFNYTETDDLQLLELPYASGQSNEAGALSMVVMLPKDVNGFKKLEASFNASALSAWLTQARSEKVKVFLPSFKMTAEFGLGETLAKMGMRAAFSTKADFSGMDGRRDLFISAVVHKAYVEVNEEGTEAAAATGTVMALTAMRPRPTPVFRADHPFLFLICDTRTGSILFLGRVSDPSK